MNVREPIVKPVAIRDLRPTQMTVGFREVEAKRREWRKRKETDGAEYLGQHMIPVIVGPKDRHYVIDHHHLTRALLEEGVEAILISVVADLRAAPKDSLWVILDNRGWCHPYDSAGVRRDFADIPTGVADMEDDPYRSLAGALRRAGGYAKDSTPFSEFIWADFLRHGIKAKLIEKDFESALARALDLAKSPDAAYLPGWCGPAEED
jgi:hypothetical protein